MKQFDPNNINGVIPAMITSFNNDESINKEGIRKTINHLISEKVDGLYITCLLYTSPSPRDRQKSRMPSSA